MVLLLALSACVFITDADIQGRDLSRVDRDGDGFVGAEDCDDTDELVFPGQIELPNQVDDDCDGRIDDGTDIYDDDGDGFCESTPCPLDCGLAECGGDCDDTDPTVYPGAEELCDGQLNDCTSGVDEFGDRDGDGYSIAQGDTDDRNPADLPTDVTAIRASVVCDIVRLEPDGFDMGCEQPWCSFDEGPVHPVTLTRPLLVMETEVLRQQWDRFLGAKNWAFPECGPTCPVTRVSWEEAFDFANVINRSLGLQECFPEDDPRTCVGWRLPTEAEWEYAARGRTSDRYAGGSNASLVGWIADNSANTVHPARLKQANTHGIYDMTGNVSEWAWDVEQRYPSGAQIDPVELDAVDPPDTTNRVIRGGSGRSAAAYSHVTSRSGGDPDRATYADSGDDAIDHSPFDPYNWHGFRLVRTVFEDGVP